LEKALTASDWIFILKIFTISSKLLVLFVLNIFFIVRISYKFHGGVVIFWDVGLVWLLGSYLNRVILAIDSRLQSIKTYLKVVTALYVQLVCFLHVQSANLHQFQHIFPVLNLYKVHVHDLDFWQNRKLL
jgi:hypothetical protein